MDNSGSGPKGSSEAGRAYLSLVLLLLLLCFALLSLFTRLHSFHGSCSLLKLLLALVQQLLPANQPGRERDTLSLQWAHNLLQMLKSAQWDAA